MEPDLRGDHTVTKGGEVGETAQIYSAGKTWFKYIEAVN